MADYGLVVGISKYPLLPGDNGQPPANLEGPVNDADGIYRWLISASGGGLDAARVKRVGTAEPFDAASRQPRQQEVTDALIWLADEVKETQGGRLYLYFSGHGWAPNLEEGALFTADATTDDPWHVYAHAWLNWFRMAGSFREFVLWMDSCMNWQRTIPVSTVPRRARPGTGVPGPAFVGLAARAKSALECKMPDGKVHGVFTWALLQGLGGGASDERARVTGESLQTFLHNAMPEFLPKEVREAGTVDLRPFVRPDPGFVFAKLPARPTHTVRLRLPAGAAGHELRIWGGQPHGQVIAERPASDAWEGQLFRGLYVAEVPDLGLRHGIQVTGAGDVDVAVTERGPAVVPPPATASYRLYVKAKNDAASIVLTDHRFTRLLTDTGVLDSTEMPGVYKVRVEISRDIGSTSERIFVLDRPDIGVEVAAPPLASPAPIPGSVLTHEYHMGPFTAAAGDGGTLILPAAGKARLSVMARYWTDPSLRDVQLTFPHPLEGLELLTLDGQPVARLAEGATVAVSWQGIDPIATWEQEVDPGAYFLRQTLADGRIFEVVLVAVANWVTQLVIRRANTDAATGGLPPHVAAIGEPAIFMRGGRYRMPDQDSVVEAARIALTEGRNILGEGRGQQVEELLLMKYANPIAGIIGAHLVVLALDIESAKSAGAQDQSKLDTLNVVVRNLRTLVGANHPDVEALSLRCGDPDLRTSGPFTTPPMFSRSWSLIVHASYKQPALVTQALWSRVHAATSVGAFFAWAADDRERASHRRQLKQWVEQAAPPRRKYRGGAKPRTVESTLGASVLEDEAKRLQIPAAGLAALWQDRS